MKLAEVPELIRFLFYVPFHFIFSQTKTASIILSQMTLMAIIKHEKKSFDGYMYDTKTMIMIGSVTTIVKRLMG